jgi:hypothetical protein
MLDEVRKSSMRIREILSTFKHPREHRMACENSIGILKRHGKR